MSERIESDRPDAGHGKKPIALAAGNVTGSRLQLAYRAYLDHAQECADCPRAPFQCDVAADLWRVYLAVRGGAVG
ncbi:hypothetical protein [Streptomyces sp. NPDC021020]|uniref:hypothetical protein n=1 Tax=Streptomyces sp. NPDC021020 TaxID=3365109 RepID=UPI0037A8E469